ASVDSITTSGNKEDYVSMGMGAALKLRQVLKNSVNVVAIEAIAAAQALDQLAPLKTSARLQRAHGVVRRVSPTVTRDRYFAKEMEVVASLVKAGALTIALA
ncbi:MAG TPA: aromatic amino acid lyase, partial [Terriglobales bacterium]|nr:aromatic amino acid lyase [Terriglobales bacterium]